MAAQNALTSSVLDGPPRTALVSELTNLYNYPRTSVPIKRGGRYFFTFNSGLQNQPSLYVQNAVDERPRLLINPNILSEDGTAALTAFFVDDGGTRVAYGISRSGSDRQEFFVRDVASGSDLPDRLRWLKFASIAWTPEADAFYYTRFPEPGSVPPGDEQYFPKVCFHRLGTSQEQDTVIFERPDDREIVFAVETTEDGRWLVITAFKGASDRSEVFRLDRRDDSIAPLFTTFEHAWTFVGDADGRLFFITDDHALADEWCRSTRMVTAQPLRSSPKDRTRSPAPPLPAGPWPSAG